MQSVKNIAKTVLKFLHIDATLNMKYDRQTQKVIERVLTKNACTVDVGCHKGEMLSAFLKLAPLGEHYAFEPLPDFYKELTLKFAQPNCHIFAYALSEKIGFAEFNFVKNAPAYSGLRKRNYAIENPDIETINVELKPLDDVIPEKQPVNLIKIDVEGGEMDVLKGAKRIIKTHKPYIIFECGIGASNFYGTKPEDVFELIADCGLKLSTMDAWLHKKPELSKQAFCKKYYDKTDYYFMAYA